MSNEQLQEVQHDREGRKKRMRYDLSHNLSLSLSLSLFFFKYLSGVSTGISAKDRATTVKLLADPSSKAADFARPGHIFPLRAREGGVLTRDGHTEAAVDLAVLAGRAPAGILCEIVSEENPTEMARLPELKQFCKKHGYVLTSIVDIAQYRREQMGRITDDSE